MKVVKPGWLKFYKDHLIHYYDICFFVQNLIAGNRQTARSKPQMTLTLILQRDALLDYSK